MKIPFEEDIPLFFDDFAQGIIINGQSIAGILEAIDDTEQPFDSLIAVTRTRCWIRRTDANSVNVRHGSIVRCGEDEYSVIGIQHDGFGITSLMLGSD